MARRRNGMLDFIQTFNAGYDALARVGEDWEKDKEKAALKEAATAQPVQTEGFTEEQGRSIAEAARAGNTITYDEAQKAYQATPQLGEGEMGPPATSTIAAQGPMTDFMGARTAGTMTPEQVDTARMSKMADIVAARDPARAMQMRQQAKQTAREDERFAMEKTRFDRESRREDLKDSDDATMRDVDAQAADWFKQRLAPDGGAPRQATPDDHIAASVFKASLLTQAGKLKEAGEVVKAADAQILAKVMLDTEQRKAATGKVAASLAAGDFEPAKEFFNRYLGGGARVTNVGPVRETGQIVIERETADGKPLPATILKSANDLIAGLQAFSNPMAVYEFAAQDLRQQLQLKADARADKTLAETVRHHQASESAAQAESNRKLAEAQAKGQAGMALYMQNNPNATPIEAEAVRTGVLAAAPTTGKDAPSEVKLAKAMVDAGLEPDMKAGLEMAVTKKSQSPAEMHKDFVAAGIKAYEKPDAAVAKADQIMSSMGYSKTATGWAQRASAAGGGGSIPAGAVEMLKSNPSLAADFDKKYGQGAAAKVLGK